MIKLKKPFRNGSGNYMTRALFHQIGLNIAGSEIEPIFTLSGPHKPGTLSARETFLELGDPTGYKWANKYLDGWPHWQVLIKCKWFQDILEEWLLELETKFKIEAIDKIREIAAGSSQQALVAAKYLATLEYKKSGKGRPSKSEITGELKRATEALEVENEDARRIGLVK